MKKESNIIISPGEKRYEVHLPDYFNRCEEDPAEYLKVILEVGKLGLHISFEGYCNYQGESEVIMIEHFDGQPQLYAWSDSTIEDHTHKIEFGEAKIGPAEIINILESELNELVETNGLTFTNTQTIIGTAFDATITKVGLKQISIMIQDNYYIYIYVEREELPVIYHFRFLPQVLNYISSFYN